MPIKANIAEYSIKNIVIPVAAHLALGLSHEFGHWLASHLLLQAKASTNRDAENTIELVGSALVPLLATYPTFSKAEHRVIAELSGPVAGLATSYASLKLINVYQELRKGKNWKQALRDGFNKKLINAEQPRMFQMIAGLHAVGNLATLLPFKTPKIPGLFPESQSLHGQRIFQDLGLI